MYLINKFRYNNKDRNLHFLNYCITLTIMGAILNSIGPVIPFLSKQYGIAQTEYSLFFVVRTVACVSGAIASKFIITRYKFHNILAFISTVIVIGLLMFSSSSFTIQCFSIFWHMFFIAISDPVCNLLLLKFNDDPDKQFWLLIGHSMFGVGCLLGPIAVYLFQLQVMAVLGIANLVTVIPYILLQSPQKNPNAKDIILSSKDKENSDNLQKRLQQNQEIIQTLNKNTVRPKLISRNALYCLALVFFIYIGQEITVGGWIPSYAVLTHSAEQKQASLMSSFFYIFITVFRFIYGMYPPTSHSKELNRLLLAKIVSSLVLIVVSIAFSPYLSCYLAGLLYGVSMAPLYAKFMTVSNEFGIELTGQDYTTIIIFAAVGEAGLVSVTGYFMGFTPHVLYFSMLLMGVVSYFLFQFQVSLFKRDFEADSSKVIKAKSQEKVQQKVYQMQKIN